MREEALVTHLRQYLVVPQELDLQPANGIG